MTLRLVARNSATDSENRIHADDVAREYGFRGGLVPGVTVYGYLMKAVEGWLRFAQVRLLKPVFDGDELEIYREGNQVTAIRGEDLCAVLTIGGSEPDFTPIPEAPLPEHRPAATAATIVPGSVLGTFHRRLEDAQPETLLNLANYALVENFVLKPWLHASSDIAYHAAPRAGEEIAVRGRIHDRFDKKGREFVVLDVALFQGAQPIQSIRHTAIYHLG
jgi:hypothetical protein